MPYSAADRLRGHFCYPLLVGKLPRDLTVGHGLPIGDLQKDLPHRLPEGGADRMQRGHKIRLPTGKINVEPTLGFFQDRRFSLNMLVGQVVGKVFLSVEPKAGQPDLVSRQQNATQR